MEPRMSNPAQVLPAAMEPILSLVNVVKEGGVPERTLELVHIRVSQINGCSFCIDLGVRNAKRSGIPLEDLFAVTAWRDNPGFTEAERAALALAEAMTRLSDREDAVPDDVWAEAARHYDEKALATLVLYVSMTNFFNRINVTTRQIPGSFAV